MNWLAFTTTLVTLSWIWLIIDSINYDTWEYPSQHRGQKNRLILLFVITATLTATCIGLAVK